MTVLGPHHDGSERYLSNPNPELDETITAFVRVPAEFAATDVVARVVHDAESFRTEATLDRTTATEQWWRVDIEAHNPVTSYRFHLRTHTGETAWLNGAGLHGWDVTDVGDFRLTTEHRPPDWVRRTAWYQIFPDRFARRPDGRFEADLPDWAIAREWNDPVRTDRDVAMRDLWGGSLNGITSHLDHLVELGVTGVYTCPFFPARSNHRYDASAFDRVDPLLGGDAALRSLVLAAGERGIRVMGDLTTNHSGDHHEWFTGALADPFSPTRSYYTFRRDGSYESWLGVPTLPKFDHRSEAFRERLYEGPDSIAGRFLGDGFGLSAMRIDVANMTGRLGAVDLNRVCATGLRRTIDAVRPDAWLLAEHGHDASADLDGGGWHGTMNYAGFTRAAWTWLIGDGVELSALGEPGRLPRRSTDAVVRSTRAFMSQIPYSVALTNMNLLGSHDSARWAFVSGAADRNAVGLAMLCTWPGSPSIFYGDEIGLGSTASWDVTTRQPFPWHDIGTWDTELLAVYRSLVHLRTSSSALAVGGMQWVAAGADHLVYVRESRDQRLLVHLARAAHEPVVIDLAALGGRDADVIAGASTTVVDGAVVLAASEPTWRVLDLS